MPLISFIIPSYNTPETLLKECLQSIISIPMGEGEKEIIVVDDGSSVPVEEMIQSKDGGMPETLKNITIIRQENKGLGAARNTGMDAAKGEFLQFVDADDYIIADEEKKVIEQLHKGDTDMVMFHFSNRKYHGIRETKGIISGAEYMLHNNLRATSCLYAFRNTEIRFPEQILHEDEQFTTLLTLKTKRLILIDAKPYFYRINTDSIVTKSSKEWINRRLGDTNKIIAYLHEQEKNIGNERKREAFKRKINQLCMDYLYNTWVLTHSFSSLKESIRNLGNGKLYPLPFHSYTWKYSLFSAITHLVRPL